MTETKTYNGWANYETWCVNLWIGNEEPSYRHWNATAEDVWSDAESNDILTKSEAARQCLADMLKIEIEDSRPELEASMWTDLMQAALSEVVWIDIADGLLENCDGYEMQS